MLKTKGQGPKYKISKASIKIMPGNKISIKNHKCLKDLPEQPQRQCSAPADEGASLPAQPAGDRQFLGPKPPRLRPLHSPCPARLHSSHLCLELEWLAVPTDRRRLWALAHLSPPCLPQIVQSRGGFYGPRQQIKHGTEVSHQPLSLRMACVPVQT